MTNETHDTEPQEPVGFTTADLPTAPEHEQPGPAAQAEASKYTPDEAPEGATIDADPDAEPFDLDETDEERTRRLARERKRKQREREQFEAWQERNAKADGRIGKIGPSIGGLTEE